MVYKLWESDDFEDYQDDATTERKDGCIEQASASAIDDDYTKNNGHVDKKTAAPRILIEVEGGASGSLKLRLYKIYFGMLGNIAFFLFYGVDYYWCSLIGDWRVGGSRSGLKLIIIIQTILQWIIL